MVTIPEVFSGGLHVSIVLHLKAQPKWVFFLFRELFLWNYVSGPVSAVSGSVCGMFDPVSAVSLVTVGFLDPRLPYCRSNIQNEALSIENAHWFMLLKIVKINNFFCNFHISENDKIFFISKKGFIFSSLLFTIKFVLEIRNCFLTRSFFL